jgi:hypothetical protein
MRLPRDESEGTGGSMRDWIADWKRWSRAERCFAIALIILGLVIPLGLLVGGITGT